jgi:crotonobetainyl-CoA:carnitine CoA-transferase CaiB-like acyl-CoA transferase
MGIPFLARNKRSMTLDLKRAAGRDLFLRLAAEADVLLEGFRPGVTARLGIDYETLRAANPRLVYCAITGYGQDGPYRERVGHDLNYLGYAGVLNSIGEAGRPPVVPGVQIADIGGGALMAAVGILTALIARGQTGRGQLVDVAMMDGAFAWNAYHLLLHLLHGRAPERGRAQMTGRHPATPSTRHATGATSRSRLTRIASGRSSAATSAAPTSSPRNGTRGRGARRCSRSFAWPSARRRSRSGRPSSARRRSASGR